MNKNCSICIYYGQYDGVPICKHGIDLTEAVKLVKLPHCPFKVKDKTPTLEEVKKEWEALGYRWVTPVLAIKLINIEKNKEISIDLFVKNYICKDFDSLEYQFLTCLEHQLLTKTFRALGWFDE